MIPKIIHFCWFGRGEKSKLIKKCIASWKKFCPDYEIIEWNEDNFDINCNTYVKEAYDNRKFAFVADYARLYAMYNYGGIYFDTDIELVKSPDELLDNIAFSGFENEEFVAAGIMGCVKGYEFFGELLNYYDEISFVKEDGSFDTTSNVRIMTARLVKMGLVENGQMQTVSGFKAYPRDYFYPFEDSTGIMRKTQNTIAIHWYDKSWIPKKNKIISIFTRPFHRFFGEDCFEWLKRS